MHSRSVSPRYNCTGDHRRAGRAADSDRRRRPQPFFRPAAMNDHTPIVLSKGVLAVGWCSLALAAFVAHVSPATGYELSIYQATPTLFWVFLALAVVIAVAGLLP